MERFRRGRPFCQRTPCSDHLLSWGGPSCITESTIDPKHRVIRVAVKDAITDELAEGCYWTITHVAARGGQWATIFDLSKVKSTTLTADAVRSLARRTM